MNEGNDEKKFMLVPRTSHLMSPLADASPGSSVQLSTDRLRVLTSGRRPPFAGDSLRESAVPRAEPSMCPRLLVGSP